MSRVLRYSANQEIRDSRAIPDLTLLVEKKINELDETEEVNEATLIEHATIEASKILEQAQQQADDIVAQAQVSGSDIIKQSQDQAESIRTTAFQEGHDEALTTHNEEIVQLLNNAQVVLSEMQQAQENYFKQYSARLGEFSLEIASSILKSKLQSDPLVMCDLVEDIMSSVKDSKWVVVTLSEKLVPLIELLQSELTAKCPTIENLDVEGKDIPIGDCIVDTSEGLIDASISEQLENLSKRFAQVRQKRENL